MGMENDGVGERRWAKLSVTKQPPSVLSTSSMAPGSPFTKTWVSVQC